MRRILEGIAFIGMTLGLVACGGDDGISKEDYQNGNATLVAGIAAIVAPPSAEVSDPKVKEIVTKWTDREVTTSEAKSQLKALGFTDAQVDAALKDEDDEPTATQTRATAATTPAATQTPPASTPTKVSDSDSATDKRKLTSVGTIPPLPNDISHNGWTIHTNDTALIADQDGMVGNWLKRLEVPNPSEWKYFPNVGNPDRPDLPTSAEKPAPWGAEYGMAESPYCENHPCDFVVSSLHYRLVTGDYSFMGNECYGDKKKGCLLLVYNVHNETVIFRDQDVDNGFTVHGRYWDGNILEVATLGLVSHASANMLGMQTYARAGEILNFGEGTNAGSNCGNPEGCGSVDVLVVVASGDRILATARTIVTPNSGN